MSWVTTQYSWLLTLGSTSPWDSKSEYFGATKFWYLKTNLMVFSIIFLTYFPKSECVVGSLCANLKLPYSHSLIDHSSFWSLVMDNMEPLDKSSQDILSLYWDLILNFHWRLLLQWFTKHGKLGEASYKISSRQSPWSDEMSSAWTNLPTSSSSSQTRRFPICLAFDVYIIVPAWDAGWLMWRWWRFPVINMWPQVK